MTSSVGTKTLAEPLETLYNWHGAETDPPDAPPAIWFRFSDGALG